MSDTHDKFGVRIYPSVAEIGGDKTVKIDCFNVIALHRMSADDRRINCEHWKRSYILQAQELSGRAVMMTASGEERAMYHATRMMSKAAYAMRQAMRVNEELMRLEPKNNGGVN